MTNVGNSYKIFLKKEFTRFLFLIRTSRHPKGPWYKEDLIHELWDNDFKQQGLDLNYHDDLRLIIACSDVNFQTNCHRSFQYIPTESGVCATLGNGLNQHYKSNAYTKAFEKVYPREDADYQYISNFIGNVKWMGNIWTFQIVLNLKTLKNVGIDSGKDDAYIILSLNNYLKSFNIFSTGIKIYSGTYTILTITPKVIKSTQRFRTSLSPEKRGCKFVDESEDLILMKHYTQKGCMFECQSLHAFRKCACYPWSHPQVITVNEELKPICDHYGNICFDNFYFEKQYLCKDSCLTDCDDVFIQD